MGRLLIVDDEPNLRRVLGSELHLDGHTVDEAAGVLAALPLLAEREYDAVITDQKMPDGDGLRVLSAAQESDASLPVIFLTAVPTVELAVESMRKGAFDFITKPFNPEVVRATVRRACERTNLVRENQLLKSTVGNLLGADTIFGNSAEIKEVREQIARVAPTDATVLIVGETGTGKELVARAIHRNSRRAQKPLIAINCAAFTETLLESELFGHERGAFTGADRARQGLFEAAHAGTLFLDEAGEMSAAAQAKLLRVLVDGQVLRVGSTQTRTVDVRVLVATHRNLEERVQQGLFRQDLYYRLAVVPIHIPPLRERPEDIPGLCEILSAQIAKDLKVRPKRMSPEALQKIAKYTFPGNIRELRNLLERAHILGRREEITAEELPVEISGSAAGPSRSIEMRDWLRTLPPSVDLRQLLLAFERGLIERALEQANGVQAEAARMLGVSRSDIGYKISKYEIGRPADAT
ncbi:MAG TPA: sigma-54 dependent transcriptional regulator [Candidatus Dormibacteraeota bacterium]|nr:sigma-54 dependent transcriptional regulator [Candidatus Dormibacteraeota bacterium]